MHVKPRALSLAVLLSTAAPYAQADLYGFYRITRNASENVAAQLSVDVTSAGDDQVSFKFFNSGDISATASLTRVYFDDGVLLDIAKIFSSAGVEFSQNAIPGELPGGNNIEPPFETTQGFSAKADSPPYHNGVNQPDEWLQILFDLQSNGTFADVIDQLNDGTLRIGLHVQGIGPDDQSDSFVNVPAPGAALLGALGLGIAGRLRRQP